MIRVSSEQNPVYTHFENQHLQARDPRFICRRPTIVLVLHLAVTEVGRQSFNYAPLGRSLVQSMNSHFFRYTTLIF